MGRLGLGLGLESEPHVVGRLRSEPRVGAGGSSRGIFDRGLSPAEVFSRGLSLRIVYYIHLYSPLYRKTAHSLSKVV